MIDGAPATDASPADTSRDQDVGPPRDVSPTPDAPVAMDVPVAMDAPAPGDVPAATDVPAAADTPVVPADVPGPPVCPPPGAVTADSTVPGVTRAPNPTIRNISVEWDITGDADRDGVVSVRYRTVGGAYSVGMPLRRISAGSNNGFSWRNRHSGSVFDLQPDTAYEVELALRDPDGGCETRTLMVRTRPIPSIPAGATVRPVTPATFAAVASSAAPGDVLDLAAGTYPAFTFTRDGMPGRPIVIRSTAGAVINGNFDMFDRRHLYITGLEVRGRIRSNGGVGIAIVRNTVNTTGDGIVMFLRSEDCYVADNVVTGATTWATGSLGVSGANVGEGILVTGPGHVIEHNRVRGFRDGISFLEDTQAVDQYSIDVIENDVDTAADDGVEADFCFHNCRILRNRFTNTFIAMSSQPGLGGPTYFVRNVAYNVILSAFKLQRSSVGDVLLHNTIVKNGDAFGIYTSDPVAHTLTRNNLMIGGAGGTYNSYSSGTGRVIEIATAQASCDLDYDGLGSTLGTFTGRLGAARFANLVELRAMTTERHAVAVDLAVFAGAVTYPSMPFPALPAQDLRLRSGGAAVDVGLGIPNINDGFVGAAPDLGAYEAGSAPPAYGPRP